MKVEAWSLYKYGEPLHDEPPECESRSGTGSGRRSGHGCPLYDWFHQGCPDGVTISEVSIKTFRRGEGWFDNERVKEPLIGNVVFNFLEMAL